MRKIITGSLVVVICALTGCPNGSDRIFGPYGSYYAVEDDGLMWSEYTVRNSDRDSIAPSTAVRKAAEDLQAVISGSVPLRNGLTEDLKKVQTIAISAFYREYMDGRYRTSERCAAVIFPISELPTVAERGPSPDMSVIGEIGSEERIFDFAKRKRMQKKGGEPGATDNPDDAQRLREDH